MNKTSSRRVSVRAVQERDFPALFSMYQNQNLIHLWAPDTHFKDVDYFKKKIKRRMKHRWRHNRVFEHGEGHGIMGFAYCYNASASNLNCCVCIVVDQDYIGKPAALRACYLYLQALFQQQHYRQLYAEVFAYNTRCIKLLEQLDFEVQGCLRQHQQWRGRYWDQAIYRLTRQHFDALSDKYKPILKRIR